MGIKGDDAYKIVSNVVQRSDASNTIVFLLLLLLFTIVISYPHSFPYQNKLHHKISIFITDI